MCKYCKEIEGILFKRKNIYDKTAGEYIGDEKRLGVICDFENSSFFKSKTYLSIAVNEEQDDWFDIRINYCPFCGKKLKYKSISNIIRAIIDYKYEKKYRKELELGICKCSKCGKTIKNNLEVGEMIIHEGKETFCQECSKEKEKKI